MTLPFFLCVIWQVNVLGLPKTKHAPKTVSEASVVCPLNYHLTSIGKRCAQGTQATDYFGTLSANQASIQRPDVG